MWKPCHDILMHIISFPLEIYIVLPNTVTNSLLLVNVMSCSSGLISLVHENVLTNDNGF